MSDDIIIKSLTTYYANHIPTNWLITNLDALFNVVLSSSSEGCFFQSTYYNILLLDEIT